MDPQQPRAQPAGGSSARKKNKNKNKNKKKKKNKKEDPQEESVDARNTAVNTVAAHQDSPTTQALPTEEALQEVAAADTAVTKKRRKRPKKHPRKKPVVADDLANNTSSNQDLGDNIGPNTASGVDNNSGVEVAQEKPKFRLKLRVSHEAPPQASSTASKEPLPASPRGRHPFRRHRREPAFDYPRSHNQSRFEDYLNMSSPRNTDASSGFGSFSAANNTFASNTGPGNSFATSTPSYSGVFQGAARPSSPVRPAMEPLSPVLRPSDPNVSGAGSMGGMGGNDAASAQPYASRIYKHTTQTPQTFVQPAPPQVVDFAENPDAIALQSNIAILLMQKAKAEQNIRTLAQIKERAKANPEEFLKALKNGEIKTEKRGGVFDPSAPEDDDDDDDEEDKDDKAGGSTEKGTKSAGKSKDGKKPWPLIPIRQDIVQVPPINWSQYGIMGESLDKLHEDQLKRPSEGKPAIIRPDGTIVPQEGGPRGYGGPIAKPVGLGEGTEKAKRGGVVKK